MVKNGAVGGETGPAAISFLIPSDGRPLAAHLIRKHSNELLSALHRASPDSPCDAPELSGAVPQARDWRRGGARVGNRHRLWAELPDLWGRGHVCHRFGTIFRTASHGRHTSVARERANRAARCLSGGDPARHWQHRYRHHHLDTLHYPKCTAWVGRDAPRAETRWQAAVRRARTRTGAGCRPLAGSARSAVVTPRRWLSPQPQDG